MQSTYGAAIKTLEQVGKVVDSLYAKVKSPGVPARCEPLLTSASPIIIQLFVHDARYPLRGVCP